MQEVKTYTEKLDAMAKRKRDFLGAAIRLFSEKGFSAVSFKKIAEEFGLKPGTLTYHFRTKEDIVLTAFDIMADIWDEELKNLYQETNDGLFVFALKIASQIVVCEEDYQALLLYRIFYGLPAVYENIKDRAAETNKMLIGELSDTDFRILENITSSIEMSALSTVTNSRFTLWNKTEQILRAVMNLYKIPQDRQNEVFEKVKNCDCNSMGKQLFDRFMQAVAN